MTISRVLAAGDGFVLPGLLADAARDAVPGVEVTELELPWPHTPFGPVAEVHEASDVEDELIEALQGVEACLTQMAPLTERVLESCPDLRLFGVGRGGPVNANLQAATRHGVTVTFAPGRNASATAEHTVALMLAASRRIPEVHAELRAGVWRGDGYAWDRVGPELAGSTAGVVGHGAIGRRVARILAAYGADVLVADPFASPEDLEVGTLVELQELFARSTFVTVHARATPETEGMVSAAALASMPEGGVVVNCARGSLVDQDAVCDALDSGQLFGAAFDVYAVEPPPPGDRLLTTPGVVLTPHLAGASRRTALTAAEIVAADLARVSRGDRPEHCANPDVLDG
ncbi:2-hydroxyacid dehydrogenase [uncultured Nocardioides sp.]|uniref:2-hydroxyacid dehydrogenase n=1 Tax=uncultured Nocardioides sp. TaxID=198441 RepID=UPI00261B7E3A|nr:2-hydroxyacid dehydrogenase [uncultured Nocardioides sp.]